MPSMHSAAKFVVFAALAVTGCGGGEPANEEMSAAARRGRIVFSQVCAACHNAVDPHREGTLGPAVAGSSLEVLEWKVLRGKYPPGYEPKVPDKGQMPPQPTLKERIGDLHAYLNEVEPRGRR